MNYQSLAERILELYYGDTNELENYIKTLSDFLGYPRAVLVMKIKNILKDSAKIVDTTSGEPVDLNKAKYCKQLESLTALIAQQAENPETSIEYFLCRGYKGNILEKLLENYVNSSQVVLITTYSCSYPEEIIKTLERKKEKIGNLNKLSIFITDPDHTDWNSFKNKETNTCARQIKDFAREIGKRLPEVKIIGVPYNHSKMILIDPDTVINGSWNLNGRDNENAINILTIMKSRAEYLKVLRVFYSEFYRENDNNTHYDLLTGNILRKSQ